MIDKIYQKFLESTGICTDTRIIKKDKLFVSIQGPNFNANKFASLAIEKGATAAIIDDANFAIPGKTILVNDGLSTLQELAKVHRDNLKIPIIGITGSNGKTTTKELIYTVLNSSFRTIATKGNLNNHIGVPLSVLSIDKDHEIAIIEMGANHIGEIAFLSSICRPTHGMITNIGKAHTGLFGGFEGVIRAKSELYDFLIKTNGTVFINQNQDILMNMSKRMKNVVFYPNEKSYYHCNLIEANPYVEIKSENGDMVKTKLIGAYNFDNVASALCVGKYFNVPEKKANETVANYLPSNNRSQIIKKDSNTIILDAYNANPSSMEKALENLANMNAENKVTIVGDMFELGDDAKAEHQRVGKLVDEIEIDRAIFCGELMKNAAASSEKGIGMDTKALLIEYLKKHKLSNSTILIKASRGMALEDIVEYI